MQIYFTGLVRRVVVAALLAVAAPRLRRTHKSRFVATFDHSSTVSIYKPAPPTSTPPVSARLKASPSTTVARFTASIHRLRNW